MGVAGLQLAVADEPPSGRRRIIILKDQEELRQGSIGEAAGAKEGTGICWSARRA
jgi:hypothetical protein